MINNNNTNNMTYIVIFVLNLKYFKVKIAKHPL